MASEEQRRQWREASARYVAAHPDRVAVSRKKTNQKTGKVRTARYRARLGKEKVRERDTKVRAAWRAKNLERDRETKKRFFERNPNYHAEWRRKKRQANRS